MKVILISQRIDFINERKEWRDSLDKELISLVTNSGYLPLVLPNWSHSADINLSIVFKLIKPSGFILSGGNDLGQFEHRDKLECEIIKLSILHRIPILGICRGMQLINQFFNGTIIKKNGHVTLFHQIIGPENIVYSVNSYHDFVINKLGDNLEPTHFAKDETIEGFKHRFFPFFGIMWHPERIGNDEKINSNLLKSIFC
jgi:gamma-glutamyl-gamma-aminobutyrate hydrolase PuuD